MRQFEYDLETEIQAGEYLRKATEELRADALRRLNERGLDGWELVQLDVRSVGEQIFVWRIWKRELE